MGHCCSSWPQEWVWRLLQLPPRCEQAGYCPYLTGSLCSLALPRDPQAGASSPGRAHYLPQAVANPCRPLLPQTLLTHPKCVCCASPAPQPDWASEPCAAAAFASPVAQLVKNLPAMQETWIWPLGWENPLTKGTGYPLQYSGLENSMDYTVYGVTKSQAWLSNFHCLGWEQTMECGLQTEVGPKPMLNTRSCVTKEEEGNSLL